MRHDAKRDQDEEFHLAFENLARLRHEFSYKLLSSTDEEIDLLRHELNEATKELITICWKIEVKRKKKVK
jgi:hypothetical protein